MTSYRRKTVPVAQVVANQVHRANPTNPATASCALWIAPEKLAERAEQHRAAGRTLLGTIPCVCGNHDRQMWG